MASDHSNMENGMSRSNSQDFEMRDLSEDGVWIGPAAEADAPAHDDHGDVDTVYDVRSDAPAAHVLSSSAVIDAMPTAASTAAEDSGPSANATLDCSSDSRDGVEVAVPTAAAATATAESAEQDVQLPAAGEGASQEESAQATAAALAGLLPAAGSPENYGFEVVDGLTADTSAGVPAAAADIRPKDGQSSTEGAHELSVVVPADVAGYGDGMGPTGDAAESAAGAADYPADASSTTGAHVLPDLDVASAASLSSWAAVAATAAAPVPETPLLPATAVTATAASLEADGGDPTAGATAVVLAAQCKAETDGSDALQKEPPATAAAGAEHNLLEEPVAAVATAASESAGEHLKQPVAAAAAVATPAVTEARAAAAALTAATAAAAAVAAVDQPDAVDWDGEAVEMPSEEYHELVLLEQLLAAQRRADQAEASACTLRADLLAKDALVQRLQALVSEYDEVQATAPRQHSSQQTVVDNNHEEVAEAADGKPPAQATVGNDEHTDRPRMPTRQQPVVEAVDAERKEVVVDNCQDRAGDLPAPQQPGKAAADSQWKVVTADSQWKAPLQRQRTMQRAVNSGRSGSGEAIGGGSSGGDVAPAVSAAAATASVPAAGGLPLGGSSSNSSSTISATKEAAAAVPPPGSRAAGAAAPAVKRTQQTAPSATTSTLRSGGNVSPWPRWMQVLVLVIPVLLLVGCWPLVFVAARDAYKLGRFPPEQVKPHQPETSSDLYLRLPAHTPAEVQALLQRLADRAAAAAYSNGTRQSMDCVTADLVRMLQPNATPAAAQPGQPSSISAAAVSLVHAVQAALPTNFTTAANAKVQRAGQSAVNVLQRLKQRLRPAGDGDATADGASAMGKTISRAVNALSETYSDLTVSTVTQAADQGVHKLLHVMEATLDDLRQQAAEAAHSVHATVTPAVHHAAGVAAAGVAETAAAATGPAARALAEGAKHVQEVAAIVADGAAAATDTTARALKHGAKHVQEAVTTVVINVQKDLTTVARRLADVAAAAAERPATQTADHSASSGRGKKGGSQSTAASGVTTAVAVENYPVIADQVSFPQLPPVKQSICSGAFCGLSRLPLPRALADAVGRRLAPPPAQQERSWETSSPAGPPAAAVAEGPQRGKAKPLTAWGLAEQELSFKDVVHRMIFPQPAAAGDGDSSAKASAAAGPTKHAGNAAPGGAAEYRSKSKPMTAKSAQGGLCAMRRKAAALFDRAAKKLQKAVKKRAEKAAKRAAEKRDAYCARRAKKGRHC